MIKKGFVLIVAAALLAAGCTGGPNNASAMMNETPTSVAMMSESASATPGEMMNNVTPTVEAMMSNITPTAADSMMTNSTATSDAMMSGGASPTQAMMTGGTPTANIMMESSTATPESMMSNSTPSGAMMGSKLLGVSLMDVNSGKSIQLSSYAGKVVLISLFSISCTDCLLQQKNLESLNMGNQNGLVVVTLDVDSKDSTSALASFARQNNYHWVFANSSDTINHGISMLDNSHLVNPSTVQTLVMDRMGELHALPDGLKTPGELSQDLSTYLAAK